MPSKTKHRKGHFKDKDEDDTYKKFSCEGRPKHRECKGQWSSTRKTGHKGEVKWEVKWAPCRKNEAVQFVQEKHGHTYNPVSLKENDTNAEKRHSKKKYAYLQPLSYFVGQPRPKDNPEEMASGKHHTRAQAADRHQNQRHRRQSHTVSPLDGARILHDFHKQTRNAMVQNQGRDQRAEAWLAQHGATGQAIPPPQDATPGRRHQRRRHHRSGHERRPEQGPAPPAAFPTSAPMPSEVPQQQFMTDPKHMSATNQGKMHAWMDDRPDWNVDDSNSDEDIAPPECFARGQTIFSTPGMPLRQDTTGGQQQMPVQHEFESESGSESESESGSGSGQIPQPQTMPVGIMSSMGTAVTPVVPPTGDAHGGQQQMLHHDMPQYGQMPQPYSTIPPPEASAPGPALPPVPVMSSHHAPSEEQRHGRRHHQRSGREFEVGPAQDPQPLSSMPAGPSITAGMVSPVGMTAPPAIPPTQYPPDGRQHQRHRRGTSGVSHHEQAPLPLTAQQPPRTMRECMASMAEEAKLANPTQSIALRPGPPPPPGMPMPPGCPHPLTQNLHAELQEASQMPGTRDMQFPMGPPQAGPMAIAAAGAFYMPAPPMNPTMHGPPHPQSTRRAPRQRQQQTPTGMSSRASMAAASASGTPGPRAVAVRPPTGAVSGPPAMSSNLRRQPPPTSMPPFPGTGPSTPGSMDLARAPPPPVPTPPSLLVEDD